MGGKVPLEKLRATCTLEGLGCSTTEQLTPLESIIGQERALRALRFGLEIKNDGFNIYIAGAPGTGKVTAIRDFLEEMARQKPVPDDWCYVNNFRDQYRPRVLRLPPGMGSELAKDMKNLVETVRSEVPKIFESEEYIKKREETMQGLRQRQEALFSRLNEKAREEGFVLQETPIGLFMLPVVEGRPLKENEVNALPPQLREEINQKRTKLQNELKGTLRDLKNIEREASEAQKKLDREVVLFAIGHLFQELKEKYGKLEDVVSFLEAVREDMLQNIPQLKGDSAGQEGPGAGMPSWARDLPFRKYEINVVVDNSELNGAPVVMELNPSYQNLFGRIEKEAQFGALVTDFTLIRGGSLHRANGGYLVIPVEELLKRPLAWEGLKRALRNKEIALEEAGEFTGSMTAKSLRPVPIPLNIKIILHGSPLLYRLLYLQDPDFNELFKVKSEFDIVMDRTEENIRKYASFFCTLCHKENLRHLDAAASARLIEYSSRLAEDQKKLSARFADIADVIREANFYARQDGAQYIGAEHIRRTIEERVYRAGLVKEKISEMINRGFILIDAKGTAVGQVNGLAVLNLGDISFGRPSRITATVGPGRKGLVDIEREVRLGGRIHSKGIMILGGYLAGKYARNIPLSLTARIVFEQSYEEVDGDSASSAELYALLSAIAGIPLKQGFAVTGSVNQKGEVQVIGGVNEKIEGFFEVCKLKGLTGEQGVLIPVGNVQNLMLREEVVEAVKDGKFHIYSVNTVDEGMEILTGLPVGKLKEDGTFEEGTVNYKVQMRIKDMASKLREFAADE